MKFLLNYLLLLGLLASYGHIKAQEKFTIHFGPVIPTSDFADDDIYDEQSGLAAIGLDVGVKYLNPLQGNGLGIFAGADLIYNPWNKDAKDMWDDEDVKSFPKYLTIPLSGGLQYSYEMDTETAIYGRFGLAFSFSKLTNLKWDEGDKYTYDLATGFGFLIGGGVRLNDKLELDLTYMGLGEHNFDIEYVDEDGNKDEEGKAEINMTLVTLTVGFNLN